MENVLFHLSNLERVIGNIKKSLTSEEAILVGILNLQKEKFWEEDASGYKSYELVAINNSVSKAAKGIIRSQMLLKDNLIQVEKLLQLLESPEDEEE